MVTAIISIALTVIGIFAMSSYMNHIYNQEQANYVKKRVEILKQTMTGFIRSDASWTRTISAPVNSSAGFGCLASKTCSSTRRAFALFDPAGVQLSNPQNPSFGTDLNGRPCNTFSLTNPDSNCPARFEFEWVVDCSSCVYQAPRVFGRLRFSYPVNFALNTERYSIDFARGKETGTVGETCASMKGVLDPVTGQCNLPFVGVPCKTALYMNGTLSNGEVECQQSPGYGLQACPANSQPVGINNKGEVLCAQR